MAIRWSTALGWKRGSCLSVLGRGKQVVGVRPSSYPLGVCKRNAGTKQNKFVEVRHSCIQVGNESCVVDIGRKGGSMRSYMDLEGYNFGCVNSD